MTNKLNLPNLEELTQIPFETILETKFITVGSKVFLVDPKNEELHQITNPSDPIPNPFDYEAIAAKYGYMRSDADLNNCKIAGVPSSKEFKKLQKDNAKLATRLRTLEILVSKISSNIHLKNERNN